MGSAKQDCIEFPTSNRRCWPGQYEFRIEDVRCLLDSEANDSVDVPLAGLRSKRKQVRPASGNGCRWQRKRRNDARKRIPFLRPSGAYIISEVLGRCYRAEHCNWSNDEQP